MGHGGTHLAPSLRTNAAGEAEELSTIDELHVVKVGRAAVIDAVALPEQHLAVNPSNTSGNRSHQHPGQSWRNPAACEDQNGSHLVPLEIGPPDLTVADDGHEARRSRSARRSSARR